VRHVLAVAGAATLLVAGIAAIPFASPRAPKTAKVMVHCPNGNNAAFVTPPKVTIAVGDSIEWRMTGQVTSDSLIISLKSPNQAWPFAGPVSKGTTSAQTGNARARGTYGYNVHLTCRVPGGGTQPVTIDPDIIIE
jgi:plastocyanin